MNSSFFIVSDRGNLKAFRAEKAAADRGARLELVQAFSFADAHARVGDFNTDTAGAFPVSGGIASGQGGGMRHQNSVGEKHYELENDRRAVRELATRITDLLEKENPSRWSFAAPGSIKDAVLDLLRPEFRQRLAESLPLDLVNAQPTVLLDHFAQVRAA